MIQLVAKRVIVSKSEVPKLKRAVGVSLLLQKFYRKNNGVRATRKEYKDRAGNQNTRSRTMKDWALRFFLWR